MKRTDMTGQLESESRNWDICIIGGGASGLGTALDAASRGYRTLLMEQFDFAKATSSRSTKLVHGGVRYLQQGNIRLVLEALRERGLLKNNAPHLVKNQSFIVPNYKWWEGPYYGFGLKVYDWMSGRLGLGPSQMLSREEVLKMAPTLDPEGLRGGVLYHDGQFDDSRLAINLAQTAVDQGAVLMNYCKVTGMIKEGGRIFGVEATDLMNSRQYSIRSRAVINATGIFTDSLLRMDDPEAEPMISPSQGVHIVLDKEFLPGDMAIMVPHTDDGRVLFAVPWHNKIIIGTTDTPMEEKNGYSLAEPVALEEEIDFILHQIGKYLSKIPDRNDIKSVFAGLRPLVKNNSRKTAELARDHVVSISDSGLITIAGGKWTTYRHMAEDVIDTAMQWAGLEEKASITAGLKIHGARNTEDYSAELYYYGTDEPFVRSIAAEKIELKEKIHPALPYLKAEVIWAVREEMCMNVEDFLARRSRALFLDAKAAMEAAPEVARLMAGEKGENKEWIEKQIKSFNKLAVNYLPKEK
jgi:glycerol-3-phosphate dehydrogenase